MEIHSIIKWLRDISLYYIILILYSLEFCDSQSYQYGLNICPGIYLKRLKFCLYSIRNLSTYYFAWNNIKLHFYFVVYLMLDFNRELNTLVKVLEKPNVNLMAFPFLYKVWTRIYLLVPIQFQLSIEGR
jgi:hypothetical protein